ncbi:MAG TPA: sigma-54 dependent transcriptional regulator [Polyangiaceae bacterium]|nr:sigma-54 dependent transcriptional regulator [Polyangiaceae bacterium]
MTSRVLLIADHPPRELTAALQRRWELQQVACSDAWLGLAANVIVIDAPFEVALNIARALRSRNDSPAIVVSCAEIEMDQAIEILRHNVQDLVTNLPDVERIISAVDELMEQRQISETLAGENAPSPTQFAPNLLGTSAAMQRVRRHLLSIAPSDATLLIQGESGTGKELVARALHDASARRNAPFVVVACGALVPSLVESELFGHTKSTSTGTTKSHRGLLQQAANGTVFLDEIGELPLALQAKLLRAMQERRVHPLGQPKEVEFNARLIVSTSKDLAQAVGRGSFRQDLYLRLKALELQLPPLRERKQDILLLAQHFLRSQQIKGKHVEGMTLASAKTLLRHHWSGNVRELAHCMLAAVAATRFDHVTVADLPDYLRRQAETSSGSREVASLDRVKHDHIVRVLAAVSGNKALASRILGLDRKTLLRKLDDRAG